MNAAPELNPGGALCGHPPVLSSSQRDAADARILHAFGDLGLGSFQHSVNSQCTASVEQCGPVVSEVKDMPWVAQQGSRSAECLGHEDVQEADQQGLGRRVKRNLSSAGLSIERPFASKRQSGVTAASMSQASPRG